jgi:hypothetical protein
VVRLKGSKPLSADFSFEGLVPGNEDERKIVAQGIKSSRQGVQDDMLYFSSLFANANSFNPNTGYEGVGKIITSGGSRAVSEHGIALADAREILVIIKIRPILKTDPGYSNFGEMAAGLNALTFYSFLLSRKFTHGNHHVSGDHQCHHGYQCCKAAASQPG